MALRRLPGYDEAVSGHRKQLWFNTRFNRSGGSKLRSNRRDNRPCCEGSGNSKGRQVSSTMSELSGTKVVVLWNPKMKPWTEGNGAEEVRQDRRWFLESMDRINRT